MSKRFVDTDRYRRALRGVDCKTRLAHEWLWQNCDHAGVWELDVDLFRFECGYTLNIQDLLKTCPWVAQLSNGNLFITDFIDVNYGRLKEEYNPHKPVFRLLLANGIDPQSFNFQEFTKGCQTIEGEGEEESEEKKGKVHNQKEEGRNAQADYPSDFPSALRTPEGLEAWNLWEQSRKEKRKKITPTSRKLQLKLCEELGPELLAIKSITDSVRNGWQGLFPPSASPTTKQTVNDRHKASIMDRNAPIETDLKS